MGTLEKAIDELQALIAEAESVDDAWATFVLIEAQKVIGSVLQRQKPVAEIQSQSDDTAASAAARPLQQAR